MGSGSSSQVHVIHLDNSDDEKMGSNGVEQATGNYKEIEKEITSHRPASKTMNRKKKEHPSLEKVKTNNDDSSDQIGELQRQLAESESQRLDLLDRVQGLEERLEYENTQTLIQTETATDDRYNNTLHAKDQYIAKLQQEVQTLQQEMKKTTSKYKRKIKSLSSQLSEAKQEASFMMFEQQENTNKLAEENTRLKERLAQTKGSSESRLAQVTSEETGETFEDGRMKVILELSEQVSEQTEKIRQFESMIHDKEREIKKMQSGLICEKCRERRDFSVHLDEKEPKSQYFSKGQVSGEEWEGPQLLDSSESQKYPDIKFNSYKSEKNYIGDNSSRECSGSSHDSGIGNLGNSKYGGARNSKPSRKESPKQTLTSVLSDSDLELDSPDLLKTRSAPPKMQRKRMAAHGDNKNWDKDSDSLLSGDNIMDNDPRKHKKKSALKKQLSKDQDGSSQRSVEPVVAFGSNSDLTSVLQNSFFLTQPVE